MKTYSNIESWVQEPELSASVPRGIRYRFNTWRNIGLILFAPCVYAVIFRAVDVLFPDWTLIPLTIAISLTGTLCIYFMAVLREERQLLSSGVPVCAQVVGFKETRQSETPILQYKYGEVTHKVAALKAETGFLEEGCFCTVLINPNNPERALVYGTSLWKVNG